MNTLKTTPLAQRPRSPHVQAKPVEGGVFWGKPLMVVVCHLGCRNVCLHTAAELEGV